MFMGKEEDILTADGRRSTQMEEGMKKLRDHESDE
jgi:hypothetical protein